MITSTGCQSPKNLGQGVIEHLLQIEIFHKFYEITSLMKKFYKLYNIMLSKIFSIFKTKSENIFSNFIEDYSYIFEKKTCQLLTMKLTKRV